MRCELCLRPTWHLSIHLTEPDFSGSSGRDCWVFVLDFGFFPSWNTRWTQWLPLRTHLVCKIRILKHLTPSGRWDPHTEAGTCKWKPGWETSRSTAPCECLSRTHIPWAHRVTTGKTESKLARVPDYNGQGSHFWGVCVWWNPQWNVHGVGLSLLLREGLETLLFYRNCQLGLSSMVQR